MSKPVLLLDLDGVFSDFHLHSLRLHGQYIPYPDLRWNLWEQFDPPMTETEFWSLVDHNFWSRMPWTPEGKKFLGLLEAFAKDRIALLTSPPKMNPTAAASGKIEWIEREMPRIAAQRRFYIGSAKALMGGPTKILVDDYEYNTNEFEKEGGHTVLVPRPWNRRFYDTAGRNGEFDPVTVAEEVEKLWESLS